MVGVDLPWVSVPQTRQQAEWLDPNLRPTWCQSQRSSIMSASKSVRISVMVFFLSPIHDSADETFVNLGDSLKLNGIRHRINKGTS